LQELRKRLLAKDAVDRNFEGKRIEKRKGEGKEAESGNAGKVGPATPGLLQYP
jgi:hypothetical protein